MNNYINFSSSIFFIILGLAIPLSIAASSILIGLICVCWIFDGKWSNKLKEIKSNNWIISIILLIFLYLIGMLWGDSHENAPGTFQALALFLMFIVLNTSSYSNKTLKLGALMFLLSTLFSAIIATLINFDLLLPLHNYTSIISDPNNSIYKNAIDQKPAFTNYNYHGILLSFSCLIYIFLIAKRKEWKTIFLILFFLICFFNIFNEAGRTGQLISILTLMIYSIYSFKKNIFSGIAILGFLMISIYYLFQYSDVFKNRVIYTSNALKNELFHSGKMEREKHSKYVRFEMLKETLNLIKEKPILGYGTGSFPSIFKEKKKYITSLRGEITTPHNTYLFIWFEIGIIGLIIFLSILFYQIKSLIKLKYGFHRILLPILYGIAICFDAYMFSFITALLYIYLFTIYKNFNFIDKR